MIFLLTGSINMAFSQCPPSQTRGIHIVQSQDNLYRISLAYGVSMGEICKWNNIKIDDILPVCTPLRVRQPIVAPTPKPNPSTPPIRNVIPQAEDIPDEFSPKSDTGIRNPIKGNPYTSTQQGKKHTVRYGENVASIAQLYGFTEKKFRELNALSPSQNVTPGSILLTTDCSCALLNTGIHSYRETQPVATTTTTTYNRIQQPSTTTYTNRVQQPSTTTTYNNRVQQPSTTTYQRSNINPRPVSPRKNLSHRSNSAAINAPYMKQTEYSMVEEINLVRSNPAGYIRHIEQYRKDKKRTGYTVPDATVNELIAELKRTPTLSTLQTSECIYNAAQSHGLDVKKTGKPTHKGSDGSMPWDRVKRYCSDFQDGNENLVGGPSSIREAVIILLIDHSISSRGHRKTILNPHWTHVACYRMGQVGSMPNTWVQKFGQSKMGHSNIGQTTTRSYNTTTPSIHSNSGRPVIHNPNQFTTKGGYSTSTPAVPATPNAAFMKYEENKMVKEINMMRANPTAYIKYIEEYRTSKKRAGFVLPDATINELVAELKNMQPLSQLQASSCVYNAASSHGQDIKRMGKTGHQGSDGSWPWDRVRRSCSNFKDGNENLVGGVNSVREAVIILLIDHGVTTRSHRRSLLNPYWTHVACYKVGNVGSLSNCWVQQFGQL